MTTVLNRESEVRGTLTVASPTDKIKTPGKKEALGASPTQELESASLASPGFLAEDFAGLHKQLKKISKVNILFYCVLKGIATKTTNRKCVSISKPNPIRDWIP